MDDLIEYQDDEEGEAEAEAEYNEYQEYQDEGEQNDLYQDDDNEPEYEELVGENKPEKSERRRKESTHFEEGAYINSF